MARGDSVPVDVRAQSALGLATAAGLALAGWAITGFAGLTHYPHRVSSVASLEQGPDQWIGFLMDLHWCRFTRYGWYESGGRFLQIIPSPLVTKS